MSGQAVYTLQLTMRNSVVACSCTELSLLSVEMEKKNLWLFKKCRKKCLDKKKEEKKDVFFIGAPIHCVYKQL